MTDWKAFDDKLKPDIDARREDSVKLLERVRLEIAAGGSKQVQAEPETIPFRLGNRDGFAFYQVGAPSNRVRMWLEASDVSPDDCGLRIAGQKENFHQPSKIRLQWDPVGRTWTGFAKGEDARNTVVNEIIRRLK